VRVDESRIKARVRELVTESCRVIAPKKLIELLDEHALGFVSRRRGLVTDDPL
jgi:hypothetical protein